MSQNEAGINKTSKQQSFGGFDIFSHFIVRHALCVLVSVQPYSYVTCVRAIVTECVVAES